MKIITLLLVGTLFCLGYTSYNESNTNSQTIETSTTDSIRYEETVNEQIENNLDVDPITKSYSEKTISYFKEIVYKNEYNKNYNPKKWKKDIKIFVKGVKQDYLIKELEKVVSELNDLISGINIEISENEYESNHIVYFGSKNGFNKLYPDAAPYIKTSCGLFMIWGGNGEIDNAAIFICSDGSLSVEKEKHTLREELTQSLGLGNDSDKYPKSIFYSEYSEVTEYAEIDKELIQMLYN